MRRKLATDYENQFDGLDGGRAGVGRVRVQSRDLVWQTPG
jgi:hypothetical protein